MKEAPPLLSVRQRPGHRRLPTLAALALCLVIIAAALSKAVDVANAGPDLLKYEDIPTAAKGDPATNPLRFTTTDPAQLLAVTPERAEEINAAIPISKFANPAATAISIGGNDPSSFVRALECLTDTIYYEAANEPLDGQRAVAQVVLNRVRHPAFPHTICGVVYQGSERRTGCQFTFTCDGSLMRARVPALWMRARSVALSAMSGFVFAPVGWSTHYHADYVTPYWAPTLAKSAVIGHHIFYRLSNSPGIASLFSERYTGKELAAPLVALAATSADIQVAANGAASPLVPLAERPVLSRQGLAIDGKPAPESGAITEPKSAASSGRTLQTWILAPGAASDVAALGAPAPVIAGKQQGTYDSSDVRAARR